MEKVYMNEKLAKMLEENPSMEDAVLDKINDNNEIAISCLKVIMKDGKSVSYEVNSAGNMWVCDSNFSCNGEEHDTWEALCADVKNRLRGDFDLIIVKNVSGRKFSNDLAFALALNCREFKMKNMFANHANFDVGEVL